MALSLIILSLLIAIVLLWEEIKELKEDFEKLNRSFWDECGENGKIKKSIFEYLGVTMVREENKLIKIKK